jgi:hypothetical protein
MSQKLESKYREVSLKATSWADTNAHPEAGLLSKKISVYFQNASA